MDIIDLINEDIIQKDLSFEKLIIKTVIFAFPSPSNIQANNNTPILNQELGVIITDGNIRTYIYPILSNPKNKLAILKEIIHKGNEIAFFLISICYNKKLPISIDNYEIDWIEYQSLLIGAPFYDKTKLQEQRASIIEFLDGDLK